MRMLSEMFELAIHTSRSASVIQSTSSSVGVLNVNTASPYARTMTQHHENFASVMSRLIA